MLYTINFNECSIDENVSPYPRCLFLNLAAYLDPNSIYHQRIGDNRDRLYIVDLFSRELSYRQNVCLTHNSKKILMRILLQFWENVA